MIESNAKFPIVDWQYEVANGDTQLGYEDWLAVKADDDPKWAAHNAMVAAHYAVMVHEFGKERADKANLGWAATDDQFCSKVYGSPTEVFTTYFDPETLEISHHSRQPY